VILASLLSGKVETAVVLVELESLRRVMHFSLCSDRRKILTLDSQTVDRRKEELVPAHSDRSIRDVSNDIRSAASKIQADFLDDRKKRRRCEGELSSALSKLTAELDG
jgi:hypothetical protein